MPLWIRSASLVLPVAGESFTVWTISATSPSYCSLVNTLRMRTNCRTNALLSTRAIRSVGVGDGMTSIVKRRFLLVLLGKNSKKWLMQCEIRTN